jgi:hypothetical protein
MVGVAVVILDQGSPRKREWTIRRHMLQSHQQFVDDTMLMGIPTIREAQAIKKVLSDFMEASRTSINQGKSQIFFFNTHIVIQTNISIILRLPKMLPSFKISRSSISGKCSQKFHLGGPPGKVGA